DVDQVVSSVAEEVQRRRNRPIDDQMIVPSGAIAGDVCHRCAGERICCGGARRGDVSAAGGECDRVGRAVEVEVERGAVEVGKGGGVNVDIRDLVVVGGGITRHRQPAV